MTEGQLKYQTLMENQRHNLEMEKVGMINAEASASQAATAATREQHDYYVNATNAVTSGIANLGKAWKDVIGGISIIGALFG